MGGCRGSYCDLNLGKIRDFWGCCVAVGMVCHCVGMSEGRE